MGQIKAGEGWVPDECEKFVLDHCAGVVDQEATVERLREFVDERHGGSKVSEALKDRAGLVATIERLQGEANRLTADRTALVNRNADLLKEKEELRERLGAAPDLPTAPAGKPPGGHGDPGAPPPPESPPQ